MLGEGNGDTVIARLGVRPRPCRHRDELSRRIHEHRRDRHGVGALDRQRHIKVASNPRRVLIELNFPIDLERIRSEILGLELQRLHVREEALSSTSRRL